LDISAKNAADFPKDGSKISGRNLGCGLRFVLWAAFFYDFSLITSNLLLNRIHFNAVDV
jgi:hypothetical protein